MRAALPNDKLELKFFGTLGTHFYMEDTGFLFRKYGI